MAGVDEDLREATTPHEGPVLRGASPRAYLALLRRRPFRNLMLASLSAALGDWVGFLAIIALTHAILGPTRAAAFAVSAVVAARVLPSLLLGPIAGVFVDRWDRKRVMIAANLGRGTVMALIPFTNEILALLLATLVIEVMAALFAPAKDAVFPTLVRREELVLANQINLVVTYGTLPLGGVLYATLVSLAGALAPPESFLAARPIALPIWFNAAAFFVSAPLLGLLTFPRMSARRGLDPTTAPGPWEQLKEGFRFIGTHPVIRALILGVMIAFASAGVVITAGEFFASLLNAGQEGYGILVAIVGFGLLIGLAASGPLTDRVAPETLFATGIGVAGVALVATALMPTLTLASAPAAVMGAGAGLSFIVGYTVLQQRATDDIRGRTFGAFNSGVRVAIFTSAIVVPTLIGLLGRERRVLTTLEDGSQAFLYPYTFGGVRITLIVAGVTAFVGAVVAGHTLRRALAQEQDPGLRLPPSEESLPTQRHGLFVAFEGGDGAGKSTQIRLLRSAIERAGHDAVVTREPGGTPIGEAIREVLLDPRSDAMDDRTEALLYAAARAQHVREVIRPALEKGAVVLCDRYVDSSVVYQGIARGLGTAQVEELNRWATAQLVPDLVVLLDLDAEVGLERAGGTPDRLEAAGLEFHRRVASGFRDRARAEPDRYLVVDATRPVEQIQAEIRKVVLSRLNVADQEQADGEEDET